MNATSRLLVITLAATTAAVLAPAAVGEQAIQPHDSSALPQPAASDPTPTTEGNWSGRLSLVGSTDYISRGLVLNRHGAVIQPSGEIGYTIYRGTGTINRIATFAGVWNSLNSAHTGATNDDWEAWYEFDWYVGGTMQLAQDWTLTATYIEFISPADAFDRSRNVELKVGYDDSSLLGEHLALHPYVKLFHETDGKAGSGSDEGTYVELGIAPSLELTDRGTESIRLTFPLTVGLGFDDFYGDAQGDNQTLGFVSGGVVLGVPLPALNHSRLGGAWTFTAGASLFYFGDGTSDFNEAQGINERTRFVGSIGLTCAF